MSVNRDFANNVEVSDGTAATGVDIRNYDSVIAVSSAAITLSESATTSGFTEVDAADLIVPEGGSEQNSAFVVGYRGDLRYLQADAGVDVPVTIIGHNLSREPAGYSVESVIAN